MERFARRTSGRLTVVGLGTRNSADDARTFVERYRMRAAQMVWDPEGRSWATFGVTYQPVTIVLGRDGRRLGRVAGTFDEKAVERAVRRQSD